MITCLLPPCDGTEYPGRDERAWKRHQISHHQPRVEQLATVDWHERALSEAKRLAATGREFTVDQIAAAAGEPLNPRSDWGTFAKSLRHLGIAEPIEGRGVPSGRESVRGSLVKVWRAPNQQEKDVA